MRYPAAMGRILTLLLGLVAVAFAVKLVLDGTTGRKDQSAPKQQLDNVREKTRDVEKQMQKNVDEAMKKANSQ